MDSNSPWGTLDGWEAPVYHAMTELPTFWGVPMAFFVGNFLLSLFVGMFWWPALVVGAGLYGIAWLGGKIEPYWLSILWEYLMYHRDYEA